MTNIELSIGGMSCGGCVKNVKTALSALPGVIVGPVTVGHAAVGFDPSQSSEAAVIAALTARGFSAKTGDSNKSQQTAEPGKGGCCGG